MALVVLSGVLPNTSSGTSHRITSSNNGQVSFLPLIGLSMLCNLFDGLKIHQICSPSNAIANVLYLKIILFHYSKGSEEILLKAMNRIFIFMGPLLISLNSKFFICLSLPIRNCWHCFQFFVNLLLYVASIECLLIFSSCYFDFWTFTRC